MSYFFPQQKVTYYNKVKNKNAWGKAVIDEIDKYSSGDSTGYDDRKRKQANYDLFNGKLNQDDFEYVCKPYGAGVGEMPADLRHYDIMSPKLRVLFGEEIKRPFNYKVITTNSEAISEKERARFKMLREYVVSEISQRVDAELAKQMPNNEGGQTPQNPMEAQQQMAQAKQALTPKEVEEYMKRDYQGSKEIQASQLLDYLTKKEKLKEKFNKGWKHALIAGEEIYWAGIVNAEPVVRTVNPLYFDCDKDPDNDNIQDSQWAKYTMRMTPGSVIDSFGEYLSENQIKDLYDGTTVAGGGNPLGSETFNYDDELFSSFFSDSFLDADGSTYIKVVHCEWRSLKKLGFLVYLDSMGVQQEMIVDEKYKFDQSKGDVSIKWEWIPEVWEGTKIGSDVYVNIRPKPNQFKDLDNLYSCKLGYVGKIYNNLNSESISMIDRMKPYQYLYNIIMYRLELDLASDKGKKFLADINQIPSSLGMDMEKWLYYFDAMGIAWINPNEEGKRGKQNTFNQWQSVDLTMAQTIQQKVSLLEYLEQQCGEVSGVTKQREGQIGPNELVGSSQQAVVQSSHITEELFYNHGTVKKDLLEALIDSSKVAYAERPKKIQYILDDMSIAMFTVDPDEFTNASYGVFVSDSARDQELFDYLKTLSHAALQNQQAELSDVIKMFSTNSTAQMKAILEKSEESRRARDEQQAQAERESKEKIEQAKLEDKQADRDLDKYKVDEDNATKLAIAELKAFEAQTDRDINNNGIRDDLEIAKLREQVRMNERKANIEDRKLDQKERDITQKSIDKDKDRRAKTNTSKK